ncbi:hypothetical protein [Natrinema ejinorense]|uniref:hypothetical protein n=1 Tax=Natrinema ejinorense TaxID=373386 RepID=UPI001FEB085F|nr:hypothetical protein [Natrinema ejinorense]
MSYVLWALLAMVCYSFAFLFMKIAIQDLPTFTVMPIAVGTLAWERRPWRPCSESGQFRR